MTPTEQDKELREQIADIFDELCEPTNKFWHRDSGLYWASKVMQLIIADRKRVALEARIDELNNVRDMDLSLVTHHRVIDRIAELKQELEKL